jgi:hypothetical protein
MYNLRKAQYLAGQRCISSTESNLHINLKAVKEVEQQFNPLG